MAKNLFLSSELQSLYFNIFIREILLVMVQKRSQEDKAKKIPQQRKTTLKWGTDGELSALDMVRILDRLNDHDLTECEIPLETLKEKKL